MLEALISLIYSGLDIFFSYGFFEVMLQFVVELSFRVAFERLSRATKKYIYVIFHMLMGFATGVGSLGLRHSHVIKSEMLQLANLIVVPLLIALLAGLWDKGFRKKIRWDYFAYAYAFAMSFAITRWLTAI